MLTRMLVHSTYLFERWSNQFSPHSKNTPIKEELSVAEFSASQFQRNFFFLILFIAINQFYQFLNKRNRNK